jgi:DNA-binding ferritin-like protein
MLSIVTPLLTIHSQIKIYHWQTHSYAEHKALDMAYEELEDSIDEFVEKYQGIFGRVKAASGSFVLELENLPTGQDSEVTKVLEKVDQWITYLKTFSNDPDIGSKTDLLNVRDDMLGTLNQLKYLLSLK